MSNGTFCEIAERFHSKKRIHPNEQKLHACKVQAMSVAAVPFRTSGAPVACCTKCSCCLYGAEIGTGLSHEGKIQAEVFQKRQHDLVLG